MSIDIVKLASRMRRKQQRTAANENVTPRCATVRERSLNECSQSVHMPGYYSLFCVHDKHKFTSCASCKRTQRDADVLKMKFLAKYAARA